MHNIHYAIHHHFRTYIKCSQWYLITSGLGNWPERLQIKHWV